MIKLTTNPLKQYCLGIALTFLLPFCAFAAEPSVNLSIMKHNLEQYHDSGNYMTDVAAIDKQAENYLQQRVEQNNQLSKPKKLAVVFDIDETSLSNYSHMQALDFGGTLQMINAEIAAAKDPAIPPTLHLYQLAEKDHVAVFFVTGRGQSLTQPTVKNLQAAGYTTWTALYLRPDRYHQHSIIPFKSSVRKQIESQGYDVVLDIGDQESDLDGGYADKVFKLPNPYYYIS